MFPDSTTMELTLVDTIPHWGGGEKWVLDLAREFRRRGHTLRLVAAEGGGLAARAEDLEVRAVPNSWLGRRSLVGSLRRELRGRASVALAISGRDTRLAAGFLRGNAAARLVFSRHLDVPLRGGPIRRFTFRRVDRVITNSDSTRRTLLADVPWFPREKVVRVYNPFDAAAFRAAAAGLSRKDAGLEPDQFVIGIFARLTRQKGHDVLLDAFPRIREAIPAARLLIVGTGDLEEMLQARAGKLGIADACKFVGHVDAVAPFVALADVTAVPSRFEGFCYSAVESEALGVPVVASRVSSIPEVVEDRSTGLLVPPENPDALAEALIQLARDEGLRKKLGQAGPAFVERFDAAAIYDQLEATLGELLETDPS